MRVPRPPLRSFVAAATAAAVLAWSALGALPALAQTSRYSAEIASIDKAEKRLTLKASMGQLTVRVAAAVALDAFKAGDKVWVTFGQDGTEPIIIGLEIRAPA